MAHSTLAMITGALLLLLVGFLVLFGLGFYPNIFNVQGQGTVHTNQIGTVTIANLTFGTQMTTSRSTTSTKIPDSYLGPGSLSNDQLCTYYEAQYGVSYCPWGRVSLLNFGLLNLGALSGNPSLPIVDLAAFIFYVALTVTGFSLITYGLMTRKQAKKKSKR